MIEHPFNPGVIPEGTQKKQARQIYENTRGVKGKEYIPNLTLAQKREIVKAVVSRFENPTIVAKRIGCARGTILRVVKAYRAGKFKMKDD